ncbi:MAG: ABC transporter permease, partial [Microbacterium sp.]
MSTTVNDLSEVAGAAKAHRARFLTTHTAGLVGLAVIVLVVFSILAPSTYPSPLNLQAVAYATPEIALLALAVTIAMATGGIDLSVVGTANLAAIATATTSMGMVAAGLNSGAAVTIGLLAGIGGGLLCGLLNGVLIAWANIAPILATLATMTIFMGAALIITRGKPLYGLPDPLIQLGKATIAVVPVSFWVLVLAVAGLWVVVNRTRLGLRLILIGTNPEAADYTGLRRRRALLAAYALSGAIAALAGILMSARTASAAADYGSSYLLLAITIAVLGGTHATGGSGPVVGVALAALILQMISSGFN